MHRKAEPLADILDWDDAELQGQNKLFACMTAAHCAGMGVAFVHRTFVLLSTTFLGYKIDLQDKFTEYSISTSNRILTILVLMCISYKY